jgi:hypothetical protein
MKLQLKIVAPLILAGLFAIPQLGKAGNPDRAAQAGGTQLLINPWARSSGWAGSNVAGAKGLEAMFLNVAGTAFTRKTEVLFSHTNWMKGSDISINAFGLTQHVGQTGAIGLSIMSVRFGDIDITTSEKPDGGNGTYTPQFLNIGVSYAKGFSDNIFGGITLRVITEKTPNVSARGIALDAGIQYIAGKHDQLKFGITLRNVGPKMKYSGDGLAFKTPVPASTTNNTMTVEQRSERFDLPLLMSIGAGYDFFVKKDSASMKVHRVTAMGTFTSYSYDKDQYKLGLEYGWREMFMIRAGYTLEKGLFKESDRTNIFTGLSCGATVEVPFGKNKSTAALDYSFRQAAPFGNTNSIGIRINL